MFNIINIVNWDVSVTSRLEKIVHIVPLGHEIDRAVKPFETHKADKVYILAVTDTFGKYSQKMIEEQRYYLQRVTEKLQAFGIRVECRNVDMFNMLELLRNLSKIVVEEKSRGNRIYINISSSGRLTSAAAVLVAMAHDVKAYYVSAERYSETPEEKRRHGLSICGETPKMQVIETFPLQLPDKDGIMVLVKLCKEGKGMKTTEIAEYLGYENVEGFEGSAPWSKVPREKRFNYLMKLNKRILDKLEEAGYIVREKRGRHNIIKITPGGVYVAHISGKLD